MLGYNIFDKVLEALKATEDLNGLNLFTET